jgi:hypothetical protein
VTYAGSVSRVRHVVQYASATGRARVICRRCVLLARVILHERFSVAQRAGLGLCTLPAIAIALN